MFTFDGVQKYLWGFFLANEKVLFCEQNISYGVVVIHATLSIASPVEDT